MNTCALTISAGLLVTLPLGSTAFAQGAAKSEGLEEIVVTAQKREQSLQDVGISVTAVGCAMHWQPRIHSTNGPLA